MRLRTLLCSLAFGLTAFAGAPQAFAACMPAVNVPGDYTNPPQAGPICIVSITAGGSVQVGGLSGAPVTIQGPVQAGGGIIVGGSDVKIGGDVTSSGGSVDVGNTATGPIGSVTIRGSVTAAGSVTLGGGTGVSVKKVTAGSSGTGGVLIGASSISVGDVVSTATAGLIEIDSSTGNVTTGKVSGAAGSSVSITSNSGGNVQVNGAVDAGKDMNLTISGVNVAVTGKISAPSTKVLSSGQNINITGTGTVSLPAVQSSGDGAHPGGTINVTAGTTLTLSNTIQANGGPKGGNGGAISILAQGQALDLQTTLDASAASAGTGNGGSITLNAGALNISPSAKLLANGGNTGTGGSGDTATGTGGHVILTPITVSIDVNQIINVDGGTGIGTTDSDGSISINGKLCQQYKTPTGNFPSTYWNCTGNSPAAPDDALPASQANQLAGSWKTNFASSPYLLDVYVFNNATDFSTFWQTPAVESGAVFRTATHQDIAIMETGPLPGRSAVVTFDEGQLLETTAHELGHAIDYSLNNPSTTTPYSTYVLRDQANLDYAILGTSAATSTPRLPCAPTPDPASTTTPPATLPGTPPFEGVTDVNGNSVCNGNVLSSDYDSTGSNSAVLQILDLHLWDDVAGETLYKEINAQMFAYRNTGDWDLYPSTNGVLTNGYLSCTAAWADSEKNGNAQPSTVPDSCGTVIGWYVGPPISPPAQ